MSSALWVDTLSDSQGNNSVDVADIAQTVASSNATVSSAKTTTYSITNDDGYVSFDGTSGGFTVTLPSPTTNAGKEFILERIDNTLANVISISGTINGDTDWKLHTINQCLYIKSNGSEYRVISHKTMSKWVSWTPSTNQGLSGTVLSNIALEWRRNGSMFEGRGTATTATVSASEGRLGLPSGLTSATESAIRLSGHVARGSSGLVNSVSVLMESAQTYFTFGLFSGTGALTKQNGSTVFASTENFSIIVQCEIANWKD